MGEPVAQRKTWDPAQAEGPSGDNQGLECRWCGCRHFRVMYTRPTWGGRVLRRTECRHCARRMTAWERPGA